MDDVYIDDSNFVAPCVALVLRALDSNMQCFLSLLVRHELSSVNLLRPGHLPALVNVIDKV